jgi:hypothetical protein
VTAPTIRRWVDRVVVPVLIDQMPRDHQQPDSEFRKRRIIAAVTLVIGATLLGLSLATDPGNFAFYPLTASVAVVWVAGGFLSGPLHLGYGPSRGEVRRPVLVPVVLGLLSGAVFVVGALVVREIGPVRTIIRHVLAHAQQGNFTVVAILALLNGLAEEVFFRGALFAAIGRRHPIPVSTVIYALVTIATGNFVLVFAAALMGTLFGLQRRASGGIMAPMITHVIWSTIMLLALPPIIGV